jgi:hypothetical protein
VAFYLCILSNLVTRVKGIPSFEGFASASALLIPTLNRVTLHRAWELFNEAEFTTTLTATVRGAYTAALKG